MTKRIYKVGVLGSGDVAKTLAQGFLTLGHRVTVGSRDTQKLKAWQEQSAKQASLGSFEEAAAASDLIVLAIKGFAAEALVQSLAGKLSGKLVIDATNPITENGVPEAGILPFFTGPNDSLMERLQRRVPSAHFVKAFSCVGSALMVNPSLSQRPTMFICGNDEGAKEQVKAILGDFGWNTEDVGKVQGARAIEPLCQLWCAPGFLRGDWSHAYSVLR